MQGTIKTYLPEKQYGFIKGDDGKDYFFHESQFKDKTHIGKLCEEAIVRFDQQATPKGYKAKNCSLVNTSEIQSYVVPDSFVTSRSDGVRGWDIIEHSDWVVLGSSSYSPDNAKQDVIDSARQIGANALINLEYFKTTGSQAGTGNGTYHYTIHNFRGRAVTLAKRNFNGKYHSEDLLGLNERADALKKKLVNKTTVSKRIRNIIWLILLFLSLLSVESMPILIIAFIFIGIKFVRSTNYDYWLKKA